MAKTAESRVVVGLNADELAALLTDEIRQRQEEGCSAREVRRAVRATGQDVAQLQAGYDRLLALPGDRVLDRSEPTDLDTIRALRPRARGAPRAHLSDRRLRDRLRGAMLARCAGCMLGKPVELWSRQVIFEILKKDRQFPLTHYIAESAVRRTRKFRHPFGFKYCTRGNFSCMERDDDIDYTILGVHCLGKYGSKLTTRNIADEWLQTLPYHQVFTAERAAYRNLVAGLPLEQVPTYRNPHREWIGAMIRADGFGYCAAGMPRLAAEIAHRDAILSHVRNGVYGEMLLAAMIAAAPFCTDIHEVIEFGLAEIPAESRLARAVRQVVAWAESNRDWMDTLDAIHATYGQYHPVHTINNAALVIMGLCHGKLDLGKTLCMTVMGGWDTDCTGATAGSVVGALRGADAMPPKWIRPLRNRLRSMVVGYDNMAITAVADMAFDIHRELR